LLLVWPLGLAVVIGSWLLVLVLSGYVGLSTILAVATLLPLAFFTEAGLERWAFAAAMALFILYTHRGNLQRMRAGVEHRFERALLARLCRGPASGEELAREAGITRAAVWKRVQALREAGVEIEASPGRGYALVRPLELLDAERLRTALSPAARAQLSALTVL